MEQASPLGRSGTAKTLAFFLCALAVTAALMLGLVTFVHWNDLWQRDSYHQSQSTRQDMRADVQRVYELAALKDSETQGRPLSYTYRERIKALEAALSPQRTNFRYELHDQTGKLLLDNLDGGALDELSPSVYMEHNTLAFGETLPEGDYPAYAVSGPSVLHIALSDGSYAAFTAEASMALGRYNEYGWLFDGTDWVYHRELDSRVRPQDVVLEYGLTNELNVADTYAQASSAYRRLQGNLPVVATLCVLSLLAFFGLLVFLLRGAGWRRDGTLAPGWQDRIPYELYAAGDILLLTLLFSGGWDLFYRADASLDRPLLAGLAVFVFSLSAVGLALLLTTAVRLKTRTLWRSSLLGRLCGGLWRLGKRAVRNLPLTGQLVSLFLLYLLGSFLTSLTLVLIPVYQGFVLWYLCRWLRQWRRIERGTARIAGGDPSFQIDTAGMRPDLRRHAEQLNALGGSMRLAVEEQLKSERFKAELIANVSHDLKTPLTSIISYVGLLKALPTEDPQAAEYIDVLDRKSQRLKKLTEDLVEASKASTGSLGVNLERLGAAQLLQQALGEYEERFAAGGLEAVFPPPGEELYVWADGRHLWRVIDNLFSNCAKYALAGTRIYLDLGRGEGRVYMSVKNVSRQPLNIPPDQLMERFIRGEESRTTEGSGLGLSIARSLTELQQGAFRIEIDGDLFKAILSFPEAPAFPAPDTVAAGDTPQ